MTSSCAVEVSLSTADWARSGSLIMVSHSSGSRLEVVTVEACVVAGHDELVEVGGFGGVQWLQREVVDQQQLDLGEPAHFGLDAVVEAGGLEPLEHCVGAQHEHADPAAHGDVAERGGQVRLAHPDRAPERTAPCGPSRNRRLVSSFHRVWS